MFLLNDCDPTIPQQSKLVNRVGENILENLKKYREGVVRALIEQYGVDAETAYGMVNGSMLDRCLRLYPEEAMSETYTEWARSIYENRGQD